MQIAIVLYPGMTVLDAIGPYEVLHRMPDADVRFVGREVGPVPADSGVLYLGATHTYDEIRAPDLVLVPGGTANAATMIDKVLTSWLQQVHRTTQWTTSVCSGSLILAAAGILKGLPATTHWMTQSMLGAMGAKPRRDQRIVREGKVVTAAGVSAGIDLGLWLVGEICGRERAEVIQLAIEYDPQPPYDSGHPSKATPRVQSLCRKALTRQNVTISEMRAIPQVAWRRTLDALRTSRQVRRP